MVAFAETLLDKAAERLGDFPPEVKVAGLKAINRLKEAAPSMDRLGERAVRDGLALFGIGQDARALDELTLGGLSFEERDAILRQSTQVAYQARKQREADAQVILGALKDVGEIAVRAALPLLLAAV